MFAGSLITGTEWFNTGTSPGSVLRDTEMSSTVFLSVLLMLAGLRGAVASDMQVFEKSAHRGKSFLGSGDERHSVRRQLHQQVKETFKATRSLALESFKIQSTPTSKISLPTFIKLYPPTAKPLHLHANMPMRFGRQSSAGEDGETNSTPNFPQRFGRAWDSIQMCAESPCVRAAANAPLPQRFGRNKLNWKLLMMLVNKHLLDNGKHWTEGDVLSSSSEEMETPDKNL
ncbi:pro-FMRFamide-related neuropeptide VF [Labrus mixtus]|uniref:pro-FMRFamide-related neuropeptide VF n=1 Tax=Labrus mixtus TaxID=508554 RepID=UPI0029C0CE90|nr:pro-FMRFamide-related neuropeptide VF [Labrus mixtus]